MPYEVHTPVFDGPFDLLLHLITREQVDLWDVSLSSIVDGYVATLGQIHETLDLDSATEFLLIAAVLLELKTRRLLPGRDQPDLDEELGLWEERDLLLARLLESKTFKDAGATIAGLIEDAAMSWPRTAGLEDAFVDLAPDLLAGLTPQRLAAAMDRVSEQPRVPHVVLDHVAPIRLSVAEVVVELAGELCSVGRATFRSLCRPGDQRLDVIVRFLALLEMFKQGTVDLEQSASFAELHVAWIGDVASSATYLSPAEAGA